MENPEVKRPSRLWYLLPLTLGILGGIAAYLLVQDRDKKFAKKLLIVGIIVTVISISLIIILPLISYLYVSKTFEAQVASLIDISSATCDGRIYAIVRNIGTSPVSISDLKFYVDDSLTLPVNCSGYINPNSFKVCQVGSGLTGTHELKIVGPSNIAKTTVFCP